jgi:hypothetical protein
LTRGVHYDKMAYMKKVHANSPIKRIEIGRPFEDAIRKYLLPRTNTGNLSTDWNTTDWVRYSLAQEIARRNGGQVPKSCKDMLKGFVPDLEL